MTVRSITRKAAVAGAALAIAGGITAATTSQAEAAPPRPSPASSAHGCSWPHVCFYKTQSNWTSSQETAAYQDVTSYWQNLGSRSYDSYAIFNSRNDDVAHLHFTNGRSLCLTPNTTMWTNSWTVDKIRISYSSTC